MTKPQTLFVEYEGRRVAVVDLARELGMTHNALYARLFVLKWPLERAVSEPVKVRNRGQMKRIY